MILLYSCVNQSITDWIAPPIVLEITSHAFVSASLTPSLVFHNHTSTPIKAPTIAITTPTGPDNAVSTPPKRSIAPVAMPITPLSPPILLTNVPIKSIAPKIGGPKVMKIPANVAIKPSIMPIAGCASVSFSIKSVIAIATSNTAAAKGAIAVATLMIMLIILPNNWISLGPFS